MFTEILATGSSHEFCGNNHQEHTALFQANFKHHANKINRRATCH